MIGLLAGHEILEKTKESFFFKTVINYTVLNGFGVVLHLVLDMNIVQEQQVGILHLIIKVGEWFQQIHLWLVYGKEDVMNFIVLKVDYILDLFERLQVCFFFKMDVSFLQAKKLPRTLLGSR